MFSRNRQVGSSSSQPSSSRGGSDTTSQHSVISESLFNPEAHGFSEDDFKTLDGQRKIFRVILKAMYQKPAETEFPVKKSTLTWDEHTESVEWTSLNPYAFVFMRILTDVVTASQYLMYVRKKNPKEDKQIDAGLKTLQTLLKESCKIFFTSNLGSSSFLKILEICKTDKGLQFDQEHIRQLSKGIANDLMALYGGIYASILKITAQASKRESSQVNEILYGLGRHATIFLGGRPELTTKFEIADQAIIFKTEGQQDTLLESQKKSLENFQSSNPSEDQKIVHEILFSFPAFQLGDFSANNKEGFDGVGNFACNFLEVSSSEQKIKFKVYSSACFTPNEILGGKNDGHQKKRDDISLKNIKQVIGSMGGVTKSTTTSRLEKDFLATWKFKCDVDKKIIPLTLIGLLTPIAKLNAIFGGVQSGPLVKAAIDNDFRIDDEKKKAVETFEEESEKLKSSKEAVLSPAVSVLVPNYPINALRRFVDASQNALTRNLLGHEKGQHLSSGIHFLRQCFKTLIWVAEKEDAKHLIGPLKNLDGILAQQNTAENKFSPLTREFLEFEILDFESTDLVDNSKIKLLKLALIEYIKLLSVEMIEEESKQKLRSKTHHEGLFLASLTALITDALGGVALLHCKSGKDRTGAAIAHTMSMLIYFNRHKKLPSYFDGPVERDNFLTIYRAIANTGHLETEAGFNSIGAFGLKTPTPSLSTQRAVEPPDAEVIAERFIDASKACYIMSRIIGRAAAQLNVKAKIDKKGSNETINFNFTSDPEGENIRDEEIASANVEENLSSTRDNSDQSLEVVSYNLTTEKEDFRAVLDSALANGLRRFAPGSLPSPSRPKP